VHPSAPGKRNRLARESASDSSLVFSPGQVGGAARLPVGAALKFSRWRSTQFDCGANISASRILTATAMRTDSTDRKNTVKQYLRNIRREVDSAALYRALSAEERKPEIAEVYKRLAAIEQAHKEFWTERLVQLGCQVPDFNLGWRTRTLIWLARRCGSDFVLPVVSTREHADVQYYEAQSGTVADGFNVAERSHARIIRAVAASMPNMSIGPLANALREAVLGANDGLASNLSLVMGVAGAHLTSRAILITGLSGLVAGACAMAMGEWLSVSTSRESYETLVDVEAREPADISEEERAQLAAIYSAQGLPANEPRSLAERLATKREDFRGFAWNAGPLFCCSQWALYFRWCPSFSCYALCMRCQLAEKRMHAQRPHHTNVRPLDESEEKRQGLHKEETDEESL